MFERNDPSENDQKPDDLSALFEADGEEELPKLVARVRLSKGVLLEAAKESFANASKDGLFPNQQFLLEKFIRRFETITDDEFDTFYEAIEDLLRFILLLFKEAVDETVAAALADDIVKLFSALEREISESKKSKLTTSDPLSSMPELVVGSRLSSKDNSDHPTISQQPTHNTSAHISGVEAFNPEAASSATIVEIYNFLRSCNIQNNDLLKLWKQESKVRTQRAAILKEQAACTYGLFQAIQSRLPSKIKSETKSVEYYDAEITKLNTFSEAIGDIFKKLDQLKDALKDAYKNAGQRIPKFVIIFNALVTLDKLIDASNKNARARLEDICKNFLTKIPVNEGQSFSYETLISRLLGYVEVTTDPEQLKLIAFLKTLEDKPEFAAGVNGHLYLECVTDALATLIDPGLTNGLSFCLPELTARMNQQKDPDKPDDRLKSSGIPSKLLRTFATAIANISEKDNKAEIAPILTDVLEQAYVEEVKNHGKLPEAVEVIITDFTCYAANDDKAEALDRLTKSYDALAKTQVNTKLRIAIAVAVGALIGAALGFSIGLFFGGLTSIPMMFAGAALGVNVAMIAGASITTASIAGLCTFNIAKSQQARKEKAQDYEVSEKLKTLHSFSLPANN